MQDSSARLILASRSPYRKALLERLTERFESLPADIDESRRPAEPPPALAARLAVGKAQVLAEQRREALVIGSDQVAALDDTVLSKPGGHERAAQQLTACSGHTVTFYTAVALLCTASGLCEQHTDVTRVNFRTLSRAEIDAYLEADQPWDCAGSFRAEGRGSILFESIDNRDPAAIIGLPLIWLAGALTRAGLKLL